MCFQGVLERKKRLAIEAFTANKEFENQKVYDVDSAQSHAENRLNKTRISRLSTTDRGITSSSGLGNSIGSFSALGGAISIPSSSARVDLEDNSKEKKYFLFRYLLNIVNDYFDYEGLRRSSSRNMSSTSSTYGSGVPLSSLSSRCQSLHKEILFMEKIMEDCFFENAYLRELHEQRLNSKTSIGRALHSIGYMLR